MREYFSSPMQSAAFFRHLAATKTGAGNLQISISFGESVPSENLRAAWQAVVARHGVLRSSFSRRTDGLLRVREVDSAETFWRTLDWQSETAEAIPEKWAALLAADAAAPIDVAAAPEVRFHEIRLPGGGGHYLFTAPTFLLDERSLCGVLIDWLVALDGTSLGASPEPIEPPLSPPELWKEILFRVEGLLRLRPRLVEGKSAEAFLLLGRDETADFKAFCSGHSLDPAAVLHAAWALTLRRFGATGDVVFSLLHPVRDSREAGYFENVLPVPISWTGTLLEWLRDVESKRELVRKNGVIDPQTALTSAGIEWADGLAPAVFEWRGPELNDLIHTALPRWINFDAKIHAAPTVGHALEARDGFRLALKVSGPSWNEPAAKELLEQLAALLAGLPAYESKPLRNVPVLDAASSKTLRSLSRGPEGGKHADSVVAAFRAIVSQHADRTAVVDGDYRLTFGELDALSDKLAAHLAHAGLTGEWNAGLFLSQSSWIPIAILGSLKAGNTIVPVDPSAPPEWVESALSTHDAGFVLCDAASSPLLDVTNRRRIILDQDWDTFEVAEVPTPELTQESPAALLAGFHDGDSPSLTALTHGMLLSAAAAGARVLDFAPGDTFLAHSAAGGGGFLDEWLTPLLAGGTTRVADDEILDPAAAEVTHVRLSAAEWANQAARALRGAPLASSSLRVVAVESGNPNLKVLSAWNQSLPGGSRIFFSPAGLCGLGLAGGNAASGVFLAAGFPVEEIGAAVCDADGHDIAPGFAGELFLKVTGWKKAAEGSGRRGNSTGLLGWRDATGALFVESFAQHAPGVPEAGQRRRALRSFEAALDVYCGEHTWTLAGTPGAFNVDEWPLKTSGWIDESALPLPTEKPSAEPVAKAVEKPRVVAAWSPVHVLQEKGAGTRLVLIHPAAGASEVFQYLAAAIGPTRRVIAIRARGYGNAEACHPSIESAAAAYLDAVFEDDPTKPFVLSGFGFGATVALEMARQLHAAGRPVPRLVLIGGIAPAVEKSGGWMSSVRSAWKRLSESVEIEPSAATDDTSSAHRVNWNRYRLAAVPLEADVIVPLDFSKESLAGWEDAVADVRIEPIKCLWSEMLAFPAVKRIAALLDERT